jgi:CheY-like chemotaxis protein
MIVDDDSMSREVLGLLGTEAGFTVESFESGEAVLARFAGSEGVTPEAVLIDMQMPGMSGNSLARLLRICCGDATVLVGMSATMIGPEKRRHFDAFLLKPFSMNELASAISGGGPAAARSVERSLAKRLGLRSLDDAADADQQELDDADTRESILSGSIYQALAQSMSEDQLRKLYLMCLDDADARMVQMRAAWASGDTESYRRSAHSIKGGCGMVGAVELALIAERMEAAGIRGIDDESTFEEFSAASKRLRRILDAP